MTPIALWGGALPAGATNEDRKRGAALNRPNSLMSEA